MVKPAYKTSEFWFTVVSFIVSGLYLVGIITDNDTKEELIGVITHAVESCILITGQVAILYRYVNSRKKEKIEYEKTRQKEQENLSEELENYIGVDKTYTSININTAEVGELIQLPNIGPSTAKKIIEYRKKHKFLHKKEILHINGIGETVYKQIENYIEI